MKLTVQKWGNSAAVRLPAQLVRELDIVLGDKLAVDVRPDGVLLTPARQSCKLADLIAQCDKNAPVPEEMAAWNQTVPHGHEAW